MRRKKVDGVLSRNLILLFILVPCLFGFTYPREISVPLPDDGNKFYLDLSAASNGSGTSTSPWNSWANAKSGISAKSRPCYLYVKGTGTVSGDFVWDQGGSGSSSELVITNWPREIAITTVSVSGLDGWRIGANYLIIDGGSQSSPSLKWYNSDDSDGYTMRTQNLCNHTTCLRGVEIEGGFIALYVRGGIRVYNNVIHATGSHCIYLYGSNQSGCRSPLIKGNIVYNAGRNGIQHNPHDSNQQIINGETTHNLIFDNMENGMTFLSGTASGGTINGLLIANNLIWDNGDSGIKWTGGSNYSGTIRDVLCYNNTIVGDIIVEMASGSVGTTYRNNIITGSQIGGGYFAASSNNLLSYSTANFESTSSNSDNFLKLKSSASTATDQGYDTNPPVDDDYFGGRRDASSVDIGAHEYSVRGEGGGSSGGCFISTLADVSEL